MQVVAIFTTHLCRIMPNLPPPLTELLKVRRDANKAGSSVCFNRTDECQEGFNHLKAELCKVALLHVPEFD